ncbi:substrate-binding domain-containing protein, partial [Escherichia coli]|uniref:substrate-binding domain-containing protein n=1 Tax=Escherichia coli TaxID=562 RepID=UPI002157E3CE
AAVGGRVVALGPGGGDIRSVGLDNRGGARDLGAALAAQGYRSALAVGAASGVRTSDDRIGGFSEGVASGGGAVREVLRGSFTRESGYTLMSAALARGVEPGTLVFGISDVVAIGVMSAIRDAGLVPGVDIAVAGFDDIPT